MPRYIVQRTFPQGLGISVDEGGTNICRAVVDRNADDVLGVIPSGPAWRALP